MLTDQELKKLQNIALNIRESIIKMLVRAGSGHSAGPLGLADVLTALYFGGVLRQSAIEPQAENRDRFVLSCGHVCPVLYATLAEAGYFPKEELLTLRALDSRLQGHPHFGSLPGIENTSGPLGQGLSQAIGMALAARLKKASWRVYCLLSEGDCEEGQTWEAVMLAGKEKLANLTAIVDRNHIQIDGFTETIMPLEPLKEKFESFSWQVLEVDGHNFEEILNAFNLAQAIREKPTVIIAHTIPGRGVDFMENKFEWHGKPPTEKEATLALSELEKLRTLNGQIRTE